MVTNISQNFFYLICAAFFIFLIIFLRCFVFAMIFPFLFPWFFRLSDDYNYYGGSMRDLSGRHGNRRKSTSQSHIGKKMTKKIPAISLKIFRVAGQEWDFVSSLKLKNLFLSVYILSIQKCLIEKRITIFMLIGCTMTIVAAIMLFDKTMFFRILHCSFLLLYFFRSDHMIFLRLCLWMNIEYRRLLCRCL